jgi:hypothetical protein
MMKWSDIIPVGLSFDDSDIPLENETASIGQESLQVRIYRIKERTKESLYRSTPERYPIALSEDLSRTIYLFKSLSVKGITLLLRESNIDVRSKKIVGLMKDLPVFPSASLFKLEVNSISEFKTYFSQNSAIFHTSEETATHSISDLSIKSDRTSKAKVSSNRVRHTVLTRSAEQGYSADQLATITGVSTPAVRHYIDLDYSARRLIDNNYIANDFLKNAFNTPIEKVRDGDSLIVGDDFNPIGGSREVLNCSTCNSKLGRPLGCYGCHNFRPIIEGDHRSELIKAEIKLKANQQKLTSPLNIQSTEKLTDAINMVNITIEICDEIIANRGALNAK